MESKLTKIRNWVSSSFQLITVGLLVFAIILITKQQNDISNLKSKINSINYNVSSINDQVDGIEGKLDDIESNLSTEIDNVRRTIIVWSK